MQEIVIVIVSANMSFRLTLKSYVENIRKHLRKTGFYFELQLWFCKITNYYKKLHSAPLKKYDLVVLLVSELMKIDVLH